jgi:hypothetical protein
MSLHLHLSTIPESRIFNWKKLVKENLDLSDPTFDLPIQDEEYESEEDDSEETNSSSEDQDEDQSSLSASASEEEDEELEALKKRFSKYLTKKGNSIDVGSYDASDPFIDDSELQTMDTEAQDLTIGIDEEEKLNFCVIDTSTLMAEEQAALKRKKSEAASQINSTANFSTQPSSAPEKNHPPTVKKQKKESAPPKPKKSTPSPPQAPKIDLEREIAQLFFKSSQSAFRSIAQEKAIPDKAKFPASLQIPLWNVVKGCILASNEKELDFSFFDQFFTQSLPFSPGSLRKLLFKVIAPSMMQKMKEENSKILPALLDKLRAKAQEQQLSSQQQVQEASKKREFSLTETERESLYAHIQGEFDAFALEEALKKAQGSQQESRDEAAFRKQFFVDLQTQFEGTLPMTSIMTSFTASKRRLHKRLSKQVDNKEAASESKEAKNNSG